ncbi:carboxypeptidase-like regulatory domain-containing protein [Catalinimonas niigatensis]|uniref:carboxypeptidase-like regulatory domain-containing protein n=1 Tax=Catalinimonas niigatensis TaxID=1397264 RepID=UPI002666FCFB|nr:carboxypeptidase-like regulatory domain-containing protein [Catalinimonas niigatensis]WPP52807.1 carboxypeptidase-like regulatory domain-containing protein [Catalinimonas niigatensis]
MKYIFLLILFVLFSPLTLLAQQGKDTTIRLSGTIVDAENQAIPFATISIVDSGKGVVSDEEGFFFIRFPKKDTLVLSTVAHEPQYLYFGDTATTDNYDLKIRLGEQTYALEEVTIFAFKDEYAFKKAVLAMDDLPEEKQIAIPGSYYGPRKEVKASPLSPVSFIADKLSKRARYEREAREKIATSRQANAVAQKYNHELVRKVTGLREEKLEEFMMYCRMKEVFVDQPNEYQVILAINQCYNDFKSEQSMQ